MNMNKKIGKIILFWILINMALPVLAQSVTSKIKMTFQYGSANEEIANLLSFQQIDYYSISLNNDKIGNKKLLITCEEIWNGELKKRDTLFDDKPITQTEKAGGSTLSFVMLGGKEGDKLKIYFKFGKVDVKGNFDAIYSDRYRLLPTLFSDDIEVEKTFSPFVFILPYDEKDGKLSYNNVPKHGVDIKNLGKMYGIKHYLIISFKLYDNLLNSDPN